MVRMVSQKRNNYNQRIKKLLFSFTYMETKNIMVAVGVLLVVVGGGYFALSGSNKTPENTIQTEGTSAETAMPVMPQEGVAPVPETVVTSTPGGERVAEFTMTSWMEKIGEKMSAHFSLKEMSVKKGDKVRITITNTAGIHDFNIDAYGVKAETPLNEKTVVEFVADKVGDFEYYCSKYNHRDIGQTGTLHVTE